MQNLKINLINDEGKLIGFCVDREIMNGLYITFDYTKVEKNYIHFNINYNQPQTFQWISSSIKVDDMIIASIKVDADNHVQYLIEENMSLKKLKKIPENIIPLEFKKIIRMTYKNYFENVIISEIAS